MSRFRLAKRLVRLSSLIGGYLFHLGIVGACVPQHRRLAWRVETSARYCKRALGLLNIEYTLEGDPLPDEAVLMVANHISYVDILLLSAIRPAAFVSSVEVSRAPLIGRLTRLAGGLFVERRRRGGIGQETDRLSDCLASGHAVGVFPEGTTGDGSRLLPFKTSLLASAAAAGVPILPVCIRYEEINGQRLAAGQRRDPIAYEGKATFFSHLFFLLRHLDGAVVRLVCCKPVVLGSREERKAAALRIHQDLSSCLSRDTI